jgi:plasmid stability protein
LEEERRNMPTLNIKGLPTPLYRKLQARARQQHRSLSQEVTHILSQVVERPQQLSITAMRGLGKELWTGIDAAEHVERERRSWTRGRNRKEG